MALVDHCFCCSVLIASGFFAAYLLIAYLIAFAFELLWILESETALPAAAVLLCAEYFAMALFAALLIHGLATKNSVCLIAWMFSVTVLTFPEAGMVIYMSIQYWRIENLYGMTELACWLVRISVNVIEVVLVQSVYTIWKDEDLVNKRFRELNMAAITLQGEEIPPLNSEFYQNNGYEHSIENLNATLSRYGSTPNLWNNPLPVPNNLLSIPYDSYQFYTTQSEFNASIFVPNFAYSDASLPGKRALSLMDLRYLEDQPFIDKMPNQHHSWIQQSITETSSALVPNYLTDKVSKLQWQVIVGCQSGPWDLSS
ncbi:unnamed protein product [Acanthoscelides obtectus]|uniref:Transmembrane protein n=1 Tax=Acanthoscelides obtectus TaxID=200917 RepID=A0A9P0NZ71_ACAOB|nr:unnamed protein product [Acanthoscelides obtectus]CAK1642246.1 hypothetical protein AOBTE_LOCUS12918 [Acanthoscelides obtectus]